MRKHTNHLNARCKSPAPRYGNAQITPDPHANSDQHSYWKSQNLSLRSLPRGIGHHDLTQSAIAQHTSMQASDIQLLLAERARRRLSGWAASGRSTVISRWCRSWRCRFEDTQWRSTETALQRTLHSTRITPSSRTRHCRWNGPSCHIHVVMCDIAGALET